MVVGRIHRRMPQGMRNMTLIANTNVSLHHKRPITRRPKPRSDGCRSFEQSANKTYSCKSRDAARHYSALSGLSSNAFTLQYERKVVNVFRSTQRRQARATFAYTPCLYGTTAACKALSAYCCVQISSCAIRLCYAKRQKPAYSAGQMSTVQQFQKHFLGQEQHYSKERARVSAL